MNFCICTEWQANFDDVNMESAGTSVAMDTTPNPWESNNATCRYIPGEVRLIHIFWVLLKGPFSVKKDFFHLYYFLFA